MHMHACSQKFRKILAYEERTEISEEISCSSYKIIISKKKNLKHQHGLRIIFEACIVCCCHHICASYTEQNIQACIFRLLPLCEIIIPRPVLLSNWWWWFPFADCLFPSDLSCLSENSRKIWVPPEQTVHQKREQCCVTLSHPAWRENVSLPRWAPYTSVFTLPPALRLNTHSK